MLKVAVEAPNPQPLTSDKPAPAKGRCGDQWRSWSPIPADIAIKSLHVPQMPLIVGRQKRDHRVIERQQVMNRPIGPNRWKVEPNYNPSLRDHRS